MSQVIKRPLARTDLKEIWRYIAVDNRERANAFLRKLDTKLQNLAKNPYMGKKRDELLPNLRSFPVGNYLIFYFPKDNGIEVVRVLQGARDIESFLNQSFDENENEQ